MACLSALLKIGSSYAYMLFDSGSNTDSITPEYAHATNLARIQLVEQITLQLGCVGSRSKISWGARGEIDFGGVKGYLYLDQVNLDRYDGIIGTPFMNKHGVLLDFERREIRFRNGTVIPALSDLEEASFLANRPEPTTYTPRVGVTAHPGGRLPRASVEEVVDEDAGTSLPTLPFEYPFLLELELEASRLAPRVTIEEVADEGDASPLPTLPADFPSVFEAESDILSGAVDVHNYLDLPPELVKGDDLADDEDSETEDSEDNEANDGDYFPDEHLFEPADLRDPGRFPPPIHLPIQPSRRGEFVEDKRHRMARSLPGLVGRDTLSLHSSTQPMHWTGEDDPHALCDDAFEDATHILGLRSSRLLDAVPLERPERVDGLRQRWFESCEDLMGPIPLSLPPLREINHEINLVDDNATYSYHMPRCPDALRPILREKINRYVSAGWWEITL
ncbi:hypothetical protein DFH06DRAFT_1346968 [Mycena polygramma]|nr:hypothetical protein DFH06DRAFT_1346968 [Mycena polygramma]